MAIVNVGSYTRRDRGKVLRVSGYTRKKRPKSKKRIVSKTPARGLFPIRDEFGQLHGFKSKR